MSASPRSSTRIARLDAILAQSPPPAAARADDPDPRRVHLMSVPVDRIRALTIELQERGLSEQDDIDALTMRLLLNDYKTAVAHLRAVANGVGTQLQTASEQINSTRKALRREEEMTAKRAAREE